MEIISKFKQLIRTAVGFRKYQYEIVLLHEQIVRVTLNGTLNALDYEHGLEIINDAMNMLVAELKNIQVIEVKLQKL